MKPCTASFLGGTKVRLTARFLRSTGQYTGSDANGKWLVVTCDCALCKAGGHCAVNEPALDYGQWDDIPKEERPKWRHFATGNLEEINKEGASR